MGDWKFRPKSKSEVEKQPSEDKFFKGNSLSESLVREIVQNSLDASSNNFYEEDCKVEVDFTFVKKAKLMKDDFISSLIPHVTAPKNILDKSLVPKFDKLDYLLIEDFNTTGLTGDCDAHELEDVKGQNFYRFYRSIGGDHKEGDQRGRHGIGRTIFASASRINSFIGVTFPDDEIESSSELLLMGLSILKHHKVSGKDETLNPYGFYGQFIDAEDDYFCTPIKGKFVKEFCNRFNFERIDSDGSPLIGFSGMILYPKVELTGQSIIKSILAQYFYPICVEKLSISVKDKSTNKRLEDYGSITTALNEIESDKEKLRLKQLFQFAQWTYRVSEEEYFELSPIGETQSIQWRKSYFDPDIESIGSLYGKFENNIRIPFKVPIYITDPSTNSKKLCWFKVFLEKDENLESSDINFIRDGITITQVNHNFRRSGVRAICLIENNLLANLLGDSENVSHTKWEKNSARLFSKFKEGSEAISFVSNSVYKIYEYFILQKPEGENKNMLINFFGIESDHDDSQTPTSTTKKNKKSRLDIIKPNVEGRKARFKINKKLNGGFSILPSEGFDIDDDESYKVKVSYRTYRGNPFKKWSILDFDFSKKKLTINQQNINIEEAIGNEIHFRPLATNFELEVLGFDINRDLVIDLR